MASASAPAQPHGQLGESWRRGGLHSNLLLSASQRIDSQAIIYIPTCANTRALVIQGGSVSYHPRNSHPCRTTFAQGVASGCPGPAAPPQTTHSSASLFFSGAHTVSLGSFKSVFSPAAGPRLSPFLRQPDRHSYLASQTSPLQHNRRKLFQASDKSHFYLWKSKRSKNTRL